MSRTLRPRPLLAAIAISVVAIIGISSPASAHTAPLDGGTTPAPGSTVTELPEAVSVEFAGELLAEGMAAAITLPADPSGQEGNWAGVPTVEGTTLVIPVDPELPGGAYLVTYRVVAGDAHPIEGTTTFTYTPVEGTLIAPAPAATETSPDASASAVPSTTDLAPSAATETTAPVSENTQGAGALPWIIGGGVLLAVLLVGGLVLRSRQRP